MKKMIVLIFIALVCGVVFFFFKSEIFSSSEKKALMKIRALPEVVEFLKQVPDAHVEMNGEEENAYLIQVYEVKDDHTATFNWYSVDKTTGEIKKQFLTEPQSN